MKNPLGFGLAALAATASFAVAGGDDEKKKAASNNNATLEKLGPQETRADVKVSGGAGKGFTIAIGDDFSIKIANRMQFMWTYGAFENAPDVNTFAMRRARTSLSGHLYDKDITYFTLVEWLTNGTTATGARSAGSGNVLDAWLNWNFWKGEGEKNDTIGLRVGAMKQRFGKEQTGTSGKLEFVDRALASTVFSGNRGTGAMIHGSHVEQKLHWNFGVFNSDPAASSGVAESGENTLNTDNELSFVLGARFDPMGDMGAEGYEQGDLRVGEDRNKFLASIGAGVAIGNHRVNAATSSDIESMAFNINGSVKTNGFHALAEIFIRNDDRQASTGVTSADTDATGFQIAGSYTLEPSEQGKAQWAFGARYSMIDLDANQIGLTGGTAGAIATSGGKITDIEAMVTSYYRGHNLKTHLGLRRQTIDPDNGSKIDNDFIEVLFQWVF